MSLATKLRASVACGLILVMTSLAGSVNAQRTYNITTSDSSFRIEAQDDGERTLIKQLVEEGKRLIGNGTTDSLEGAVKKFTEALSISRRVGDRYAEASVLSYIGKAYDFLGENQKSLDCYEQALTILHEVGDAVSEAKTLNNIGLNYDARGEKRKALEFYNRSLDILSNTEDKGTESITLVNIGLAYAGLGEKQKALNYYQRALAIMRAAGELASEAVTLNNLGRLYDSMGEKQKALEYYEQALPLLRTTGDMRNEAVTLNNIGYVYDSLDEKQKALAFYTLALPVLRASGDRFKEAVTINNIGLVYHSLGQLDKALDYFTQALQLRQTIGDRPGVAVTQGDIGRVYDDLGQSGRALDYYTESLRTSQFVEDHEVEASTLRRIALLEEKRGNLSIALASIEAALAIVETLRTRITSQDLRASYFASVHEYFETYISILMRMHRKYPLMGYDALALKASERARARSTLEMLAEASADIRQGVAPELLERERVLQQRLRESAEKQDRFFQVRRTFEEIQAFKKENESPLNEYQQIEAEIRSASPRYAALTQPTPLGLREIQNQTLDQNTLLLEYSLGEKKSFLWLVTPTTFKSFELPPRAEIETAAKLVYGLLTTRNRQIKFETAQDKTARVEKADKEFEAAASRLSQMLLGRVATQLEKKRLLIVGDGMLDYIPFAALPIANNKVPRKYQPLIVDHDVVALPSASTLALLRSEMVGRVAASKTIAVIADPVFDKDDARINPKVKVKKSETRAARGAHVTRRPDDSVAPSYFGQEFGAPDGGLRIQRLPFTRLEADSILALVASAETKRAVDFDANRAIAINPDLGKYRYVHFATHGVLNSQNPELSGIVLSLVNSDGLDQDGFLWAHEVFNLHLPVEMVVLSGCRTGLGKAIRGEGLVGLTRGFMYAGARRVVVSLWDVSDEASAELMTEFYKSLLGNKRLSPASALRSAQITLWKNQRWRAPYYWASFVIQGEAN